MNSDPKLDLPEKILMFAKSLPSQESLFVIKNYNFELREILQNKQELLKEMEVQRSKSENELELLDFAIANMSGETEKVKLLLQEDVEKENYWRDQLKQAEEMKLASVNEILAENKVEKDYEIFEYEIEKITEQIKSMSER